MPKYSPWKDEVSRIVLKLKEAGIVNQLILREIRPRYLLDETLDKSPKPFKLEHILSSLVILMIGLLLAWPIFLLEVLTSVRKQKSRSKKRSRVVPF